MLGPESYLRTKGMKQGGPGGERGCAHSVRRYAEFTTTLNNVPHTEIANLNHTHVLNPCSRDPHSRPRRHCGFQFLYTSGGMVLSLLSGPTLFCLVLEIAPSCAMLKVSGAFSLMHVWRKQDSIDV